MFLMFFGFDMFLVVFVVASADPAVSMTAPGLRVILSKSLLTI